MKKLLIKLLIFFSDEVNKLVLKLVGDRVVEGGEAAVRGHQSKQAASPVFLPSVPITDTITIDDVFKQRDFENRAWLDPVEAALLSYQNSKKDDVEKTLGTGEGYTQEETEPIS